MNYRCIVVDDEELGRNLIINHINQLEDLNLIASCKSAIEASQYLNAQEVDLMFLDIEMPVLKGTDFLRNLANPPNVIFTTAYRDFALEGFDLNVIDYLLKPITFSRFFKAIERFKTTQQTSIPMPSASSKSDHLYIRSDRKMVKILFSTLHYAESLKDYIHIHTDHEVIVTKMALSTFSQQLDPRFMRIHRSFIVNTDMITAYTKQDIEIGTKVLPIGESYKKAVYDHLN